MDDSPQAAGAAAATDSGSAPPGAPGAPPEAKECTWCGETIPVFADRCSHCAGFLPIAEGRAFGHHFFYLFCSIALFLGTLLPWEGQWWDSYGTRSINGAFLLALSGYGMVAAYFNIFHRRMIVWPVILAALDGCYAGWVRVMQIASSDTAKAIDWSGDMMHKKKSLIEFLRLMGPGLWLVVTFSTLFWLVFVVSVIQGGRSASARKDAEKASRAAKRSK